MPEIGGQHGQPGLRVGAVGMPPGQGGDGETVPQIIKAGAAGSWPGGDAGRGEQPGEGAADVGVVEPGPGTGDEERRGDRPRA